MAKQTLRQRIGTGIVLGAVGLGSLVGGCESYNEYDALSLASTSAVNESQTPQQAMFFGLMSDHFKEQGNRYDRRQVAGQNAQQNKWAYIEEDNRITARVDLSTGKTQKFEAIILKNQLEPVAGWIWDVDEGALAIEKLDKEGKYVGVSVYTRDQVAYYRGWDFKKDK
jgi:hypothetical protein